MFSNKFKYVKFSKGTARNNPDMIINEYNRIIQENYAQIKSLWEEKHTVHLDIRKSRVEDIMSNSYKTTVALSSVEIVKCYEKIKATEQSSLNRSKYVEKIQDELEMFKRKYKKSKW